MTSDALPADISPSIQSERSRRLHAAAGPLAWASLLCGAANIAAMWGGRPIGWLAGWAAALLVVFALQVLLQRTYQRSGAAEPSVQAWEQRFGGLALVHGLLWAALPVLAMPLSLPQNQLFSASVLVLAAVATRSLGGSALAFYGFVVPPILSVAGIHVMGNTIAERMLAGLLLPYLMYLAYEQRQVARRLAESVATGIDKDGLLRRLGTAEAAAQRHRAEHEQLFDLASIGVLQMREGRIVRVNPHLTRMLGYTAAQLIEQPTATLCWSDGSGGDRAVRAALEHGLGASCEGDIELRRHDDRPLWVHVATRLIDVADASRGQIAVIADITDRREREVVMQRLAHEDPLTGLPNRRLLQDRMQQAFVQAQRRGRLMAVLLVDLDDFKKINENYGHQVGDDVLICVAQRLAGCVRGSDTVSRLGGDEFVVLLNDPGRGEDAQIVAEKLIESISTPIRSGARTLFVSASVGICMFPRDAQDAETMLRRADAAMYRAKQAGRGAWRLHPEASGSSAG